MEDYMNKDVDNRDDTFKLEYCPNLSQINTICAVSASDDFVFCVTNDGVIKCFQNDQLYQALHIVDEKTASAQCYRINCQLFSDKKGNHCILKYGKRVYYFSPYIKKLFEITELKETDIVAIGFDIKNDDQKSTGDMLVADSDNRIFLYHLALDKGQIREGKTELFTLEKKDEKDIISGISVYIYIYINL